MASCRHPDCNEELKSERGRSIHESRVHGEIYHDRSWDTKEYLREKYVEEGMKMKDIAEENDVPYNTVREAILKHGIETRNPNETRYYDKRKMLQESIEKIKDKYQNEKMPAYKIADEYGVDDATITRLLEESGVETRDIQEQQRATTEYPELYDYDWLWQKYREEKKYCPQIAEEIGCSEAMVYVALLKNDVPIWDHGETISGERHPRWNENKENYYGPNWQEKREKAIQKEDSKCKVCGLTRKQHREKYKHDIEVHHIIPLRDFDTPQEANKISNLIPLCTSCHRKWEGIPVVPNNE